MTERMDFAGGKYTLINDNGTLSALRHGEPWDREFIGDNLVYWMLVDALALKAQIDILTNALNELRDALDLDDRIGEISMHAFIDSVVANTHEANNV
jgi:hypothetical protein